MKKATQCILCVLSLMFLCISFSAQAEEGPVSGFSWDAFSTALQTDALTLMEVALPSGADGKPLTPLCFSKDAKNMLALVDGAPAVVNTHDGTVSPIWHLAPDVDAGFAPLLAGLGDQVEPNMVSWSGDGRYLSFGFPRAVLTGAGLGQCSNVWIADIKAGTMRPICEDHAPNADPSLYGMIPRGTPLRAVFDPKEPVLYYERMEAPAIADVDGHRQDGFYRYHPETFESELIGQMDAKWETVDPLWMVNGRLVAQASALLPDSGGGLLLLRPGEKAVIAMSASETAIGEYMYSADLMDWKGSYGVLLSTWDRHELSGLPGFLYVYLDGDAAGGLSNLNCIHVPSPPEYRWFAEDISQVPAAASGRMGTDTSGMEHEVRAWLRGMRAAGELLMPDGLAMSPDNRYTLVSGRTQPDGEALLYVIDTKESITGKIDTTGIVLAQLKKEEKRRMEWLADNTLLIATEEGNKVFRFMPMNGQDAPANPK